MQALGGLVQLQRPCALVDLHTSARCQLKTHVQSPWRIAGKSVASLTSALQACNAASQDTARYSGSYELRLLLGSDQVRRRSHILANV